MKPIEVLTPEQERLLPVYRDKWLAIGLSTEPADRKRAEAGVAMAYKAADLAPPKTFIWLRSPLELFMAGAMIKSSGAQVMDQVWAQVRDQVWAQVGAQVRDQVKAQVWAQVWAQVRAQVRAQVWAQVKAQVRAQVWAQVGDQVVFGQHDANWLSFYEFFLEQFGLAGKISGLCEVARSAGWFIPHKDVCLISERPSVLHRNEKGQLHKDGGPALAYPDGFSLYRLNGVRMTEEHVLTSPEELSPESIITETNAEIRRELIRKVGIGRMLAKLKHSILHTSGDYELLSVRLDDRITDARFLKMTNPSIGCFHVEAVHPTCQTVEHANNWRASQDINKAWKPIQLT